MSTNRIGPKRELDRVLLSIAAAGLLVLVVLLVFAR
jgi:hypothetical protein